ncbi:pectin lyase-like protein [Aspergillus heteromorphus CBS 117.55]|uniref:Pectin lyase-like protein n=1 Tax=Aspergillus heteromorphus CBS 117.55 TaxID=1448321 RepID=A0A317VGX4_9EURO|nr:pectin lyase-like protein [Aspergillus heteromorphus CBS 117.55]PWY72268.1 pectin lyase-like protein [Aspergillus heteromorphus CBS 117.55]
MSRRYGTRVSIPLTLVVAVISLLLLCIISSVGGFPDVRRDIPHGLRDFESKDEGPASNLRASFLSFLGTLQDAEKKVRAAHTALAAMNRGRFEHPHGMEYGPDRGYTLDESRPVPTPPYRAESSPATHGNNKLVEYTDRTQYIIPRDVVEAARIVAEASPLPLPGDYGVEIAQVFEEHRSRSPYTSDAHPQDHQAWNRVDKNVSNPSRGAETDPEAHPSTEFWMTTIEQRGSSPFAPPGYKVWRNVRDYGARGDGVSDDTAAINAAISDGGRCGQGCGSSTIYPAFVYFPSGTYLVSSSIIQYYNTEFYGNPFDYPTILAASSFVGLGVISSDVYVGEKEEWYINTNNFLRSIRNFKIDITRTNPTAYVCGIHWQVAQGTSLENIIFYMMQDGRTTQQGIYMENGSGGFLTNLTFVGGNFGAYLGNQQFTTTRLTFLNCKTAVQIHWDWAWTMQDLVISNCTDGIVMAGGAGSTGQGVGSLIVLDTVIASTKNGIVTSLLAENSSSFLIQNSAFVAVETAILDRVKGQTLLAGGSRVNVQSWGFGRVAGASSNSTVYRGADVPAMNRSSSLTRNEGYLARSFFQRQRPAYTDIGVRQIVDVKAAGAVGDGRNDDTAVLNSILARAASTSSVVFFPFGVYIIRDTLHVPVGSRIIGQAWAQIMATGARFQDERNPHVAVRVGNPGDTGIVEIQSMLFTVSGPTAGVVLVEWNVHQSAQGSAGLWDSHFRVGGAIGSDLQLTNCPKGTGRVNEQCRAASLLLHLTAQSSAYFENVWVWTADHDLDSKSKDDQIDIYAARGVLIESHGPTWMYATASEHNILYQYQIAGARDLYMAMIQTESPYFQPSPKAPTPFTTGLFASDPTFSHCPSNSNTCAISWALRVIDSTAVYIMGTGFYSWFSNYVQDCLKTENCQQRAVEVSQSSTDTWIYNLVTKGTVEMIRPVGETPTYAANNVNGFMSSILAWIRVAGWSMSSGQTNSADHWVGVNDTAFRCCGRWYTAVAGDTCNTICGRQGISSDLFLALNPSLGGAQCDGALVQGRRYCVGSDRYGNSTSLGN